MTAALGVRALTVFKLCKIILMKCIRDESPSSFNSCFLPAFNYSCVKLSHYPSVLMNFVLGTCDANARTISTIVRAKKINGKQHTNYCIMLVQYKDKWRNPVFKTKNVLLHVRRIIQQSILTRSSFVVCFNSVPNLYWSELLLWTKEICAAIR